MTLETRKKTILVVDDSPILLEALTKTFESAGWEVGIAEDGEEVFRKFTAYEPTAVLLDIVMPKINGTEVCRLIKGHPTWRRTFLVVMSSRMSDKDAEAYRKMGADNLLRKPFEPQEALAMVQAGIL